MVFLMSITHWLRGQTSYITVYLLLAASYCFHLLRLLRAHYVSDITTFPSSHLVPHLRNVSARISDLNDMNLTLQLYICLP